MKKAIIYAILLAFCFSLCACGSTSSVVSSDNAVDTNLKEIGTAPEEATLDPVIESGDSTEGEEEQSADVYPIIGNWHSDDGTSLTFNDDNTGHIHVEVNYGNGLMGSDNDKDFVWKYDPDFDSYIVDIGALLSGKITERDGKEIFSMVGVDFVRTDVDN